MDAVLLAAGLGTRMRPLTDVLPKCLAPIRGRPLLEYWFRLLFESEVDRVLVNTHAHAHLVEAYVRSSPWSGQVRTVHERQLLGTGGTLVRNLDFFGDTSVLVAHADNLTQFSLHDFLAAHAARPSRAALTMMTFTTPVPESCGIVTTDARGIVTGFFEKVSHPPGNRANAAVYMMEPEVIRFALDLRKPSVDISTEVLPNFVGRIATWHNGIYHRDIGTLASWREAQKDYPGATPQPPRPDPWASVLDRMPLGDRIRLENCLAVGSIQR
jgi:mannose-1-phosphate guanylyltransferase